MHSSRMRTICCSGRPSYHAYMPLPGNSPPATHAPCHTCPLPCMPPATHALLPCMPLPHMPPAMLTLCHTCLLPQIPPCHTCPPGKHAPPAMHAPCHAHLLPHMPPPLAMHAPLPCTFLGQSDTCKNITFPQLLLRAVKIELERDTTLIDWCLILPPTEVVGR